jgi:amino acid transporter
MGAHVFMLLFELFCSKIVNSSSVVFLFSAMNTINILQALYSAFFSIGILQFLFVLITNAPYLIALFRMAWHRDSEYRRKVFYKVCYYLYEL